MLTVVAARGIDETVSRVVTPLLYAFYGDIAYDVSRQDYAKPVRSDGQCTSEVIIMMADPAGNFAGAEGYEDLEQALKVLQAAPGEEITLEIFGDKVTRIGKGVSDAYIINYNRIDAGSEIRKGAASDVQAAEIAATVEQEPEKAETVDPDRAIDTETVTVREPDSFTNRHN